MGNKKWETGKWGNGTATPGTLTQVKEDNRLYMCKVASSSISIYRGGTRPYW